MSDRELKYPTWQVPFQEAMVELDRKKLAQKIQNLETVIFERLQKIASDTDHNDERKALANAAFALRELKKDKLSYPDWNA